MPKIPKPKTFPTEAELCSAFIAAIGPDWTAYAETAGWDILLARKADGLQIGFQAKLKLNNEVVAQALEQYGSWAADRPGPDCRAILVPPEASSGFDRIGAYIGLTIVRMRVPEYAGKYRSRAERFYPGLPQERAGGSSEGWYEWAPSAHHELPEYIPDVAAGSRAPVQLTDWKIRALKIAVLLEHRGYVTRSDFTHLRLDHRRWLPSGAGWLVLENGHWIAGPAMPDFRGQHPIVYEQIKADMPKWAPIASRFDLGPPAPMLPI